MGKKNKLTKFAELNELPFVLQHTQDKAEIKSILSEYFRNYKSRVLELACGRGEYTIGLADMYPDSLHIGIDIQGERIWAGAQQGIQKDLQNVLFFRVQIETIADFLPKESIDEIWITFPDPFLREKKAKKRLTSPRFLEIYKTILKDTGKIHLKTDSKELFEYTQEIIAQQDDLEMIEKLEGIPESGNTDPRLDIITKFEKKWRGLEKEICYLQYKVSN
ncbi:tRNA (guanosine(46)-N7)-methyltransferase TrmB [Candidatus Dojkabacteria bacterium]|uniref:tRNA (guanine-N(7)-)-methyltransferase n=1 Tax=Candidatus Dojkabacteria bacterium TaxID=2099670 RepID=A0A955L8H8_9BACT|nr:tRNA (guanosine(46)-N7)-methyltransferase TrmB [Candidatus Dojkabacteria bacterium]